MKYNDIWVDYEYVHFRLDYNEVKDKQLIHRGNQDEGMLIIADSYGKIIKMFGYEKIDELDGEQ